MKKTLFFACALIIALGSQSIFSAIAHGQQQPTSFQPGGSNSGSGSDGDTGPFMDGSGSGSGTSGGGGTSGSPAVSGGGGTSGTPGTSGGGGTATGPAVSGGGGTGSGPAVSGGGGTATGPAVSGGGGFVEPVFYLQNPLDSSKFNSVGGLISGFVDIFTYLVIIFAALAIIYVGFRFVMARGNMEEIKERKNQLLYIVIGVAIVIGARIIISVVINTLEATGIVTPSVINSAKTAASGK